MTRGVEGLTARLAYGFTDAQLLERALTHRSAGKEHNERLEFLGDAALNLLIAAELYRRFPDATEGQLSRMRASIVNDAAIAASAATLDLGSKLILGAGERKSGGSARESIIAGALEALIGAVYLDGGSAAAQGVILRLFGERLDRLSPRAIRKDAKTRLQEYLQSERQALPEYRIITVEGDPHAQTFTVECAIEGMQPPARGSGASRRKAEQVAAKKALERLGLA